MMFIRLSYASIKYSQLLVTDLLTMGKKWLYFYGYNIFYVNLYKQNTH